MATVNLQWSPSNAVALTWSNIMAVVQDIDVYQEDDVTLSWSPASGVSPTTITSWTLSFTLYSELGDDVVLTVAGSIVSGSAGTFTVTLSSSNLNITPGVYYYFCKRTDSGNKNTITRGKMRVWPSE